ncbi:reverse transcriptase domain-containing protein, partial [Tanacetum coccineum]
LHQGSAINPYFLALILDELSRGIQEDIPWCLVFVDDIVLVLESAEDCASVIGEITHNEEVDICIGDKILQPKESFRYLGSILHKSGKNDDDVSNIIMDVKWMGHRKLLALTKALVNRDGSNGIKNAKVDLWRRPQSAPVRRVKALVVDILRRRGRPKVRWEDRVKHDMKELLLSEDMTSDRNEWRARIRCFLFMLACSFLLCLLPCLCACSVPSMLCVVAFAFCVPCFSCLLLVSVLVCFRVLFKGGAIVYTCWIEKMESVQDISECGDGQKVNYTAGSFVDFMTLMRVEFCPNNEMQKLETEFWNHAIVGVGHAAYTDRFHKLARLVPHQVTPENKRIERYIYGLASQIRGMKASTPTDEAIRNGSLKRNPERRGNGEEPSRDRNVKDDNKRTRIGNDFATTANPVRREYVGAAPKAVPKMVNPVNARNPTAAHGACFECGGTDHFKAACPRLNQAHRPGNRQTKLRLTMETSPWKTTRRARKRSFMLEHGGTPDSKHHDGNEQETQQESAIHSLG